MKQTIQLILLTIICTNSIAQVWQRTYGVPGHAEIAVGTVNSYDNGFIISTNGEGANILKADINGNVLWMKKYLYINNYYIGVLSLSATDNGIIYQSGGVEENSSVFGWIISTDECSIYKWCKKNTLNTQNYSKFIKVLSDRNIVSVFYGASDYPVIDRYQIYKIDSDGNVNWTKQILPGTQTYFSGTEFQQMCLTSDGGSLLAGYTYYPFDTTNNPYDGILQPCLVKHDILGNRQWVYPPMSGADTNCIGFFNACVQVGDTYYAAGSNYNYGPGHFLQPLVACFDLNGNLLSYISSGPDTMYHSLSQVVPVSDTSILLISAANTVYTDPNYLMVFIADTLGYFTKGFVRHDLIVSQFGDEVSIMKDNKFLIPCSSPIGGISANTDIVAIKLNANLEYDSIYTQPFTYDSLCPYPIVSDTVVCNCEPFVSVIESEKSMEKLNIAPNPAQEWFTVTSSQANTQVGELHVYDMLGSLQYEAILPTGTRQTNISCVGWKAGLYLVRWLSGGMVVSGKVVVK